MAPNPRFINPQTIAKPPGYTHVVEATAPGRTVYIAGQLGFDVSGTLAGDFPAGGAGLQHRHGGAAAGLALPGLHGRMMPHRAMHKRVSFDAENDLDNAGNSRATGGPIHLTA